MIRYIAQRLVEAVPVLLLASLFLIEGSDYVTGEIMTVDGGRRLA